MRWDRGNGRAEISPVRSFSLRHAVRTESRALEREFGDGGGARERAVRRSRLVDDCRRLDAGSAAPGPSRRGSESTALGYRPGSLGARHSTHEPRPVPYLNAVAGVVFFEQRRRSYECLGVGRALGGLYGADFVLAVA